MYNEYISNKPDIDTWLRQRLNGLVYYIEAAPLADKGPRMVLDTTFYGGNLAYYDWSTDTVKVEHYSPYAFIFKTEGVDVVSVATACWIANLKVAAAIDRVAADMPPHKEYWDLIWGFNQPIMRKYLGGGPIPTEKQWFVQYNERGEELNILNDTERLLGYYDIDAIKAMFRKASSPHVTSDIFQPSPQTAEMKVNPMQSFNFDIPKGKYKMRIASRKRSKKINILKRILVYLRRIAG